MLLAGCLTLTLGGCGSTELVGSGGHIQIGLSEYRVSPQRVSAHPGPLTLVVYNFGRVVHNLAATRGGRVIAQTHPIAPGASAVLTLEVSSGSYVLVSTLFDDQSLGAYGSLIVSR